MIRAIDKIPVPPLSEFLIEDFLKPMGLTAIDYLKVQVYQLLRYMGC